jgi:hypothetical protein
VRIQFRVAWPVKLSPSHVSLSTSALLRTARWAEKDPAVELVCFCRDSFVAGWAEKDLAQSQLFYIIVRWAEKDLLKRVIFITCSPESRIAP